MPARSDKRDGQRLRQENDRLSAEVAQLRRALLDHPSAQALRFVAPFIRDAIEAGVWKPGLGPDSVEHEVRSALVWLDRFEAAA